MTIASSLDLGSLEWVKPEIDKSLKEAIQNLEIASNTVDGLAKIKFCQTHLHQARGALTIIGLDGLQVLGTQLDSYLEKLSSQEVQFDEKARKLSLRALAIIGNYLYNVSQGQPDQPLRLLPILKDLAKENKVPPPEASDLFFPDPEAPLPKREEPAKTLSGVELVEYLRKARLVFDAGLLTWLKSPGNPIAAQQMRVAAQQITDIQTPTAVRALWLSALAFFDALAQGAEPNNNIQLICAQLGSQLRHMVSGSLSTQDKLLRAILFQVAHVPAKTSTQKLVHKIWGLDDIVLGQNLLIPDTPIAPIIERARIDLEKTEQLWSQFASGQSNALLDIKPLLENLAHATTKIGRPSLVRLLAGLQKLVEHLKLRPDLQSERLNMDVATSLILVSTVLDRPVNESDLNQNVDTLLIRLETFDSSFDHSPPLSNQIDVARQSQEQAALRQIVQEIRTGLTPIEHALDDFFRGNSNIEQLEKLNIPLTQLTQTMNLLGDVEAQALLDKITQTVRTLASQATSLNSVTTDELAKEISALGLYLEALEYGQANLSSILNPEAVLIETKKDNNEEHQLTKDFLENIQTAINKKVEPSQPPILPSSHFEIQKEQPSSQQESKTAHVQPPQTTATVAPTLVSHIEIDDELLSIFLEEAQEVIETIQGHLTALKTNCSNREDLVTVRRGFHTLKGSGRMVGLSAFGEAAWEIEQTLNKWMQLEWVPTPALLTLIEVSKTQLKTWIDRLTQKDYSPLNVIALVQESERLRSSDAPIALSNLNQSPSTPNTETLYQEEPILAELTETIPNTSILEQHPDEETTSDLTATIPNSNILALFDSVPTNLLDLEEAQEFNTISSADVVALESPCTEKDDDSENAPSLTLPNNSDSEQFEDIFIGPNTFLHAKNQNDEPSPPLHHSQLKETEIQKTPEIIDQAIEFTSQKEPELLVEESSQVDQFVRIGSSEISKGLYDLYAAEARQHLDLIAKHQAMLSATPTSLPDPTFIRSVHTLAGISGTAGIPAMLGLARALENALMRLVDANRAISAFDNELLQIVQRQLENMFEQVIKFHRQPETMPELESQLDHMSSSPSAEHIEVNQTTSTERQAEDTGNSDDENNESEIPAVFDDIDAQLLPLVLEESRELLSNLRATLRQWREQPQNDNHPKLIARILHTLKGGARMAGAMTLGEQLHGLESRLNISNTLEPDTCSMLIDSFEQEVDNLDEAYSRLSHENSSLPPIPNPTNEQPEEPTAQPTPALPAIEPVESATASLGGTLKIKADTIDQWVSEAGEIGISRTRIEGELRVLRRSLLDLTENVIRLRNQLREIEIQAEVQMHNRVAHSGQGHEAFDPLEMDRFTRLQELTRMMAESVNDVTTVQQNLLRSLDGADAALNAQARMTRDLQQVLMRARMLPFDRLADRLHRVVRQSAKDLGKRANLDLIGGRIEVDRSLLDGIISPLEHMLRNALAHGIETPEERIAKGKPALGQVTLALKQEGNEIVLELSDDGAGLNYERIREKATAAGFIREDEPVDTHRLANLIFLPGFSTAEVVSAVSGRGVGMDVVRTDISGLGGRIELSSNAQKGTRFSIHLPLTLISTQALLVQANQRSYAIPASMVAQVLEVRTEALEAIRERGEVEWQGRPYAYHYLPRLLGDQETQPDQSRFSWIMLLHAGSQTIALHVDQLRSTQEIIIKRAGPQLARMIGISGATVMGDGEIVLIINPIALTSRISDTPLFKQATKLKQPEKHQDTVMVVDDSLTVRKITGRMLEREGFKVLTAKDGIDALEQLREASPDIILSDIEMPRMDGFDLLRSVRADNRIGEVPVIMITSRLADKHRNYASELGADHYLGKPYQEDELLELIRHYIKQSKEVQKSI